MKPKSQSEPTLDSLSKPTVLPEEAIHTIPPATEHAPLVAPLSITPKSPRKSWGLGLKTFLSIILFFVFVFSAAAVLNAFVFQSYYVDGSSMTPTLHNQDRLIISKVEKTTVGIEHKIYIPLRGQIVVLDSSVSELTAQRNEQIIKRVIGLPGDRIHIDNGVVTIYNSAHPDGFDVNASLRLNIEPTYSNGPVDYDVPSGSIFVLGDNRGAGGSFDSRIFGTVTADKIIGRLWIRVLPLNQTGVF